MSLGSGRNDRKSLLLALHIDHSHYTPLQLCVRQKVEAVRIPNFYSIFFCVPENRLAVSDSITKYHIILGQLKKLSLGG